MRNSHILDIAHTLINASIHKDDVVIDMTMGNGYDTLFLANLSNHVYSFDIQKQALINTKSLLKKHGITHVHLVHDSHEHVLSYVDQFKYVVYNLGYLPHGDKTITTRKESTIESLKIVMKHLEVSGIIWMVIYPGHPLGYEESIAIEKYLETITPENYKVVKTYLPYQNNFPPYLITIHKQKEPK